MTRLTTLICRLNACWRAKSIAGRKKKSGCLKSTPGYSTHKPGSMTEPIRFSVIIPAYNAVSTIEASVESCLGQSYPAFEIIVINDGSSDGTGELLESRFGRKIHLVNLTPNMGPSAARNSGLRLATGTHI